MHKKLALLSFITACILLVGGNPTHAQEIDFLIQGDNYTPAFYKGLPLWTNQTKVTILAIPSIPGVTNTRGLNYKWTKNNVVLGTVSGIGRNSLAFIDSVLGKSQTIKLEVLSANSAILASETFTLTPTAPSLLVYEDNPLYGVIFHREASTGYSLIGQEVTFTAFPLFYSIRDRFDPGVNYLWRTNTGDSETRNSVTYRTPEGVSGSSQVTLSADHKDYIIQSARKSFLVEFGQNNEL